MPLLEAGSHDAKANTQIMQHKSTIKLFAIFFTISTPPKFINYYDFKIFVTLDQKLQIERLKNRNPLLLDRFINEWIPKEEAYFDKFETLKSADKVITSRIN